MAHKREMDTSLRHFLRQRNVDEALISELDKDKIDTAVILLMSDHDLAIPHYGDRVALVAFCRRSQTTDKKQDRKQLLEKLRTKIGLPP